jgi:hypothetical protein
VATAIFFCGTTTHKLFVKYRDATIMIKYEDVSDGLKDVPFPAITFNNELQFQLEYNRIRSLFFFLMPTVEDIKEMFGEDRQGNANKDD